MTEVALQTEQLTRDYRVGRNTVTALQGVDIAVKHGEFVAIMGPSGCGKSTLLNLIGGLDQPTAGRVLIDGHDLAEYDEEQLVVCKLNFATNSLSGLIDCGSVTHLVSSSQEVSHAWS